MLFAISLICFLSLQNETVSHTKLLCLNHSGGNVSGCDVILIHSGSPLEVSLATKEILPSKDCACSPESSVSWPAEWVVFLAFALFLRIFPGLIVVTFSLSASSWTLRNRHPHKQNDIMKNRPQILAYQQNRWGFGKGAKKKKRKVKDFGKICMAPLYTKCFFILYHAKRTNFNLNKGILM